MLSQHRHVVPQLRSCVAGPIVHIDQAKNFAKLQAQPFTAQSQLQAGAVARSEERRVGKECVRTCRSWWSPYHEKNKRLTQHYYYSQYKIKHTSTLQHNSSSLM